MVFANCNKGAWPDKRKWTSVGILIIYRHWWKGTSFIAKLLGSSLLLGSFWTSVAESFAGYGLQLYLKFRRASTTQSQ